MLSVEEALRAVLENTRALNPRRVSLESALGAVLAEDVAADLDSPPFDKALVVAGRVRVVLDKGGVRERPFQVGPIAEAVPDPRLQCFQVAGHELALV